MANSWEPFYEISPRAKKKREQELQRAKQEAEAQAKTLQILNGISRELSTLLGTDALLKRIGQLLFHLIEYSTFSILLLDSDGQNLKHHYSVSGSFLVHQRDIPFGEGLVGFAVRPFWGNK